MIEYKEEKSFVNIRNIKSSYIIKKVLSFLDEKKKLNIIIYNKEFQKMISVNLKDYKSISRKYKIGEKNGKGKEFNNKGKLIFEGEYLNGKRNGEGIEYDDGILIFEGEYLNGKRNGRGKEYNYKNQLVFEGVYLKGKRLDGKGYNINGNLEYDIKKGKGYIKEYKKNGYGGLIFEGEYLNGKGKKYNYDGILIFEGEYLNGERNGKGKELYRNGKLKFEGEYFNGKQWTGKGYNINDNLEYEIKKGKGNVKEYDEDGTLTFEGEYLNDLNGKEMEKEKNTIMMVI